MQELANVPFTLRPQLIPLVVIFNYTHIILAMSQTTAKLSSQSRNAQTIVEVRSLVYSSSSNVDILQLLSGTSRTLIGDAGRDEELVLRTGQVLSKFVDSQILAKGRIAWQMMEEKEPQPSNLSLRMGGNSGRTTQCV